MHANLKDQKNIYILAVLTYFLGDSMRWDCVARVVDSCSVKGCVAKINGLRNEHKKAHNHSCGKWSLVDAMLMTQAWQRKFIQ